MPIRFVFPYCRSAHSRYMASPFVMLLDKDDSFIISHVFRKRTYKRSAAGFSVSQMIKTIRFDSGVFDIFSEGLASMLLL